MCTFRVQVARDRDWKRMIFDSQLKGEKVAFPIAARLHVAKIKSSKRFIDEVNIHTPRTFHSLPSVMKSVGVHEKLAYEVFFARA